MNDSIANTLAKPPSERSEEVRSGMTDSRWFTAAVGREGVARHGVAAGSAAPLKRRSPAGWIGSPPSR